MTKEEVIKKLTNVKMYVNGKSEEVQKKLFSFGIYWEDSKSIKNLKYPFLYIELDISDRLCIYCGNNMQNFINKTNKEMNAEDILSMSNFEFSKGDVAYFVDHESKNSGICIIDDIKDCVYYSLSALYGLQSKAIRYTASAAGFLRPGTCDVIRMATNDEKNQLLNALKIAGKTYNFGTNRIEDITFTAFDKVLMRYKDDRWVPKFYNKVEFEDGNRSYYAICDSWPYDECIPYKGNEDKVNNG